LLYDLDVERFFVALFQIATNDKTMYAKIQNFTNEINNERRSITNANGYRILMQNAKLTPGYINKNGDRVDACPDGRQTVLDETKQELVCEQQEVEPSPQPAPSKDQRQLMISLLIAALIAMIVGVYFYRARPRNTKRIRRAKETMTEAFKNKAMFPARLQVPATVSFEYQLLSGQSI
jgi:hypothetical protein